VAYDIGIVTNPQRNTLIVDTARHFLALGKSVFIIVHRIEHGRILSEIFHRVGLEVPFISGEEDPNIIKSRLKEFEKKTLKCLVSSSISDEGLDIPAVDILILGVGNKSALKTIQRVGRGLRKKDVGENVVSIIDFIDSASSYLYRHSVARIRVYVNMELDIFEVLDREWKEIEKK
jgi:superfamily II DNA or RNA helicase